MSGKLKAISYHFGHPLRQPLPAHSKWPPGHSGYMLGSTCRLGGADRGLGHTGGEFGWLSAQICRPSAQQSSPNGTSSALKSCFSTGFHVMCSGLVGWLAKGRKSNSDVALDYTCPSIFF
eukprot:831278-Pelagomonas_calceolata.AAC.4